MSNRKSVFGIAWVVALALSAIAAANVSATGGTAYTCVKDAPNGKFAGAHCLEGAGEYVHKEIAKDTTTTITGTNANTTGETKAARSALLKGALAGVQTEITCKELHSEGTLENHVNASGEMYVHTEGNFHFTGCLVTAPAGKGCQVNGETIATEQLTATSEGQEGFIKVTPNVEGAPFMTMKIEGCSIAALNNTFPITGSLKGRAIGATFTTTHEETTKQSTLKFGGVKAGLDGAVTSRGHSKAGEETSPIVVTKTP